MITRDQLVRDVIADPDADAPREAFAAWGVARGDLQAKLTSIQLAEARARRLGDTDEANRCYLEADHVLAQHQETWAREVLAIAQQVRFFRGFVEAISIDVPTFLARAGELFALAPIRAVQFVDVGPHIDTLAASSSLGRLVSIQIYNRSHTAPIGDAGLRTFIASPHLTRLAMLSVPLNDITFEGVEALAASPLGRQLRYVSFGNNPVDRVVETYGEHFTTGEINNDSISLPPLGRALEAKYGELPWLHSPSLFRMYPPDLHDV